MLAAVVVAFACLGAVAAGGDRSPEEKGSAVRLSAKGDSVRIIQLDTLRADNRPEAAYCASLNISFFAALAESPLWWASRTPVGLDAFVIPTEDELRRMHIADYLKTALVTGSVNLMLGDSRHIYSEFRTLNPAYNPSLLKFDVVH